MSQNPHLVVDQNYHDAVVNLAKDKRMTLKNATEWALEQVPEIKKKLEVKDNTTQ